MSSPDTMEKELYDLEQDDEKVGLHPIGTSGSFRTKSQPYSFADFAFQFIANLSCII